MVRVITLYLAGLLVMGALVAVGFIRGCSANSAENKIAEEIADVSPAYTMTAGQLYAAFLDDEHGAEVAYTGRVVQISGVIDGLTNGAGTPYVSFEGRGAWGVKCYLTEEEYAKIDDLDNLRSQRLVMKGRVEKRDLFLNMRGCVLLGRESLFAPGERQS